MSADDTSETVEQAWIDLLKIKPDGFKAGELLAHLNDRFSEPMSMSKLVACLTAARKDGKLEPIGDNPIHYILKKGDEAMPKKDRTTPTRPGCTSTSKLDINPAAAVDRDAAAPEAAAPTEQPARRQKTPVEKMINKLIIFRAMVKAHGFETQVKTEGCELNFEYSDLDQEFKADPKKFQGRFDQFEAAMKKFNLMDTFEACGELRSLFTGRNMFAIRKAFGPKQANDIYDMVKDKTRMEELRSLDLTTAVGLVKKAKDAIRQHEAAQAAAAPPPRRPIADIIGNVLDNSGVASTAKGTGEKKDPKPAATSGKAERKPSVSPPPTDKPTTEGPVADSSATVPPPVVPPIPVNPPTPAPTPVVETEAAKPPHDDAAALQRKVNSLTDQVRLVSQERDGGRLKLSTAVAQVASLESELKTNNEARQRFEGDLATAMEENKKLRTAAPPTPPVVPPPPTTTGASFKARVSSVWNGRKAMWAKKSSIAGMVGIALCLVAITGAVLFMVWPSASTTADEPAPQVVQTAQPAEDVLNPENRKIQQQIEEDLKFLETPALPKGGKQ